MQWLMDKFIYIAVVLGGGIITIIWQLVCKIINQELEKRDVKIDNLSKTLNDFKIDVEKKLESLARHEQANNQQQSIFLQQILTKLEKNEK